MEVRFEVERTDELTVMYFLEVLIERKMPLDWGFSESI